MTLWSFLLAAVGPLAVRVLIALGISVLTVAGVGTVADALIDYVQSNFAGMPAALAGLVGLAGVPEGVGIILGALNARIALWTLTSATRWAVKAPT